MRDFEAEGQLAAEEQDAGAVILDFYARHVLRKVILNPCICHGFRRSGVEQIGAEKVVMV